MNEDDNKLKSAIELMIGKMEMLSSHLIKNKDITRDHSKRIGNLEAL